MTSRVELRFQRFCKALKRLRDAISLSKRRKLSSLEKQGLIQSFELTYELAFNLLRDFIENQGYENRYGPKEVVREAFKIGLIVNGEVWMEMIKSRNLTSHTYDEQVANNILQAVKKMYFEEFCILQETLVKLKK